MSEDLTAPLNTPQSVRVRVRLGTTWSGEQRFVHTFRIGRSADCQVVVPERVVSRIHAEVRLEAGQWWLADHQSTHGLYVQENDVTVQGINDAGLVGVRIDFVAYDKGTVAGSAISKAQFKVLPLQQRGLFGGDVYHTFATLDTQQQNRVFFGNLLRPGEDLLIRTKLNTNAATARFRVGRTLIYKD